MKRLLPILDVTSTSVIVSARERFGRLSLPGVGTGLGLAISKRYVESMDGSVTIESVVGAGSTFTLRFPPADQTVPRSTPPVSQLPTPCRGRVLLIDDDRLVVSALRRCLKEHDVTTASGTRDAIALLDNDREFDVIICDFMMPLADPCPDSRRRIPWLEPCPRVDPCRHDRVA